MFSRTDIISNWHWPDIPGLHDFRGEIVHTADWCVSLLSFVFSCVVVLTRIDIGTLLLMWQAKRSR